MARKPTRDQNDARQNAALRELQKLAEQQDDSALVVVMSSAEGRQVVCKLARDLGWMGDVWDAGSARQTDYNAGKQGAAKVLMGWAERVAPEQFLTAIGEATRRDVEQAQLAEAAITPKDQENDDG